ncbi:MAG: beta-1,6-N-acetylglucosaminyltransferase [Pseudomonadota bacterium]
MRAAFVILAHERFDRVGQLARCLTGQGAEVVVHVDRQGGSAALDAARREIGAAATVISTQRTVWGRMGLVDATLDAVRVLLRGEGAFSHVCLLSGSCLPVRPLGELDALLAGNAQTDFIESVPVATADWVQDGLSEERFTLWHVFAWREQRWLFDTNVALQRRIGVRRKLPGGLAPHLGLQWWCLSRATLERICALPDLDGYRRFFRNTWIPDESFFQSLVRVHGAGPVDNRSLTLQRFDPLGRPYVFHDDHLDLLSTAEDMFARKIDPDADGLYSRFLNPPRAMRPRHPVSPAPFLAARDSLGAEGAGTVMPGRWPRGSSAFRIVTAKPYMVLIGTEIARLRALRARLLDTDAAIRFHGVLFGDTDAEFADDADAYAGNISKARAFRDHRPAQFLRQVLWSDRAGKTVFLLRPRDDHQVEAQLCRDPNARLVLVGDKPAADILRDLRRPAPRGGRRRKLRLRPRRIPGPTELNAWVRTLEPGDDAAVLTAARDVLRSDWSDPTGWSLPGQGAMS